MGSHADKSIFSNSALRYCMRAKDQHLHVQIVYMSYFYNSVY